MSIREKIDRQMKEALRGGRKRRLRALRLVKSELEVARTSGQQYDEVSVLKSYAKKLRKSAEEYEELQLPERAEAARRDLEVVREFLPEQMGREELEEMIRQIVAENAYGPRDLGKVMRQLMEEHGDVVDGRMAQQVTRQVLAESA